MFRRRRKQFFSREVNACVFIPYRKYLKVKRFAGALRFGPARRAKTEDRSTGVGCVMQAFEDLQKLARVDMDLIPLRIEKMFEARGCGDFETYASFFAPWVAFEFGVSQGLVPCYGRREGIEAFTNFVRFNYTNYKWLEHEITDVHIEGDGAVVRRTCLCKNRGTGLVQRLNCCTLLRFRDGLIEEYVEYVDTFALARLLYGDN